MSVMEMLQQRFANLRLYNNSQPQPRDIFVTQGNHSKINGRALSPSQMLLELTPHGVTVKVPELVAVPPGVVMTTFPVIAKLGTVADTLLSELTVNVMAFTPPKVTFVVCVRPVPSMVTTVPIGPLVGAMLLIVGVTLNCWLLFRFPLGRTTVTVPVLAPLGTVAVM